MDQDREPYDTPRETINIRLVSLTGPPEPFSPALPAKRTLERRGVRASVWEAAPVKRWLSVERWLHGRQSLSRSYCECV